MKNGVVISDAGPIFSLAILEQLNLLNEFFDEIHIPNAVWEEIIIDKTTKFYPTFSLFFEQKNV